MSFSHEKLSFYLLLTEFFEGFCEKNSLLVVNSSRVVNLVQILRPSWDRFCHVISSLDRYVL